MGLDKGMICLSLRMLSCIFGSTHYGPRIIGSIFRLTFSPFCSSILVYTQDLLLGL